MHALAVLVLSWHMKSEQQPSELEPVQPNLLSLTHCALRKRLRLQRLQHRSSCKAHTSLHSCNRVPCSSVTLVCLCSARHTYSMRCSPAGTSQTGRWTAPSGRRRLRSSRQRFGSQTSSGRRTAINGANRKNRRKPLRDHCEQEFHALSLLANGPQGQPPHDRGRGAHRAAGACRICGVSLLTLVAAGAAVAWAAAPERVAADALLNGTEQTVGEMDVSLHQQARREGSHAVCCLAHSPSGRCRPRHPVRIFGTASR